MEKKYQKLLLSIGLDLVGFIPFIDLIWAPISGIIMTKMYSGTKGKVAAIISILEEIIPFTDVIPTFTMMWIYTNLIQSSKNQSLKVESSVFDNDKS